jgi:hypothetical protein
VGQKGGREGGWDGKRGGKRGNDTGRKGKKSVTGRPSRTGMKGGKRRSDIYGTGRIPCSQRYYFTEARSVPLNGYIP